MWTKRRKHASTLSARRQAGGIDPLYFDPSTFYSNFLIRRDIFVVHLLWCVPLNLPLGLPITSPDHNQPFGGFGLGAFFLQEIGGANATCKETAMVMATTPRTS